MDEQYNLSSNWSSVVKTDHFMHIVQMLHVYALPAFIVLGIPGNILSFVVFSCSSTMNKLPSSTYMAALAITDTGFLVLLFFTWLQQAGISSVVSYPWCQIIVFSTYVFSFLSVWFVVLFMIERYIAVCYPLKALQLCTKRRARLSTVIISVLAMLLYSHSFWTTFDRQGMCEMRTEFFIFLTIMTYVDTVATFIVPFTAILVMNLRIIMAVRDVKRRSHWLQELQPRASAHHTSLSKTQMKLTKSLVIVSSVFLMLVLPSHANRFYALITVHFLSSGLNRPLEIAQHLMQFLYYLTFVINVLLYAATSHMFRKGTSEICKKIKRIL